MSLLAAAVLALSASLAAAAEPNRPNLIFILTDDQGYGDLSAHGNPRLRTPNLDRLRAESARFADFHVSPTCAPTRAALLTGRHEFAVGVTHTILERERLAPGVVTLPEILARAGYATGIFGKWHLGDEPDRRPDRRGFGETFIHGAGGIGQSYQGSCGDTPGNTYEDPFVLHNGRLVRTKGYCTDVFFRQAGEWMRAQVAAGRPFYLHLATNAPHSPYQARPADAARHLAAGLGKDEANFLGMIENIDENVGRLLAEVDRLGIDQRTLVVFMTDNGTSLGHRIHPSDRRGAKGTPFLGGTRAPSFWRWRGTIPPRDLPQLAAHLDFLPTIAELSGAAVPGEARRHLEGISLAPLLLGGNPAWPERILVTHVGRWPRGADPDLHRRDNTAVRTARWSLVSLAGKPGGMPRPWQLFDLDSDPGQRADVSALHPEVVRRLSAHHDDWWRRVRPGMVNEDAPLTGENAFRILYRRQIGEPPPRPIRR